MPATGVPTAGAEPPVSGPVIVAHTVVSVGPYALTIERPGAQRATSPAGQGSPATTSVTPSGRLPGSSAARDEGGTVRWVTPCAATAAASGAPGSRRSGDTVTRQAPVRRARHSSQNDASKLGGAKASTRLPAPAPRRSRCVAAREAMPRWETSTPFGFPEEPEVWIT